MWNLAKQEWRLYRRHAPAWTTVAVMVLLMTGAGAVGRHWVASQHRMQQAARADQQRRVRAQQQRMDKELGELRAGNQPLQPVKFGARHGTSIGHYEAKPYAILPPSPLAALAVGDTDVEVGQVLVSIDPKQFSGRNEIQQPLWQRAGRFDAAFLIAYVLPILLLAAIGPAIAADRGGPLSLIAAQGYAIWRVALIRVLVRGLPVLIAAIASLWVIAWPTKASALPAMLWITLAVAGYGLVWMGVAALANARAGNAAAAMARLTAAWILAALVIPALVNATATMLRPVSSRAALEASMREAQQDVWERPRDHVMSAFFQEHPDVDPKSLASLERYMIWQMRMVLEEARMVEPLSARYDMERRNQASLARSLRFLSPVLLIQDLMEESAGSGYGRRARFEAQLNQFFHTWQDFFVPKIYYRIPVNHMNEVPTFQFIDESWMDVVRRTLGGMAVLVACVIGLTVLALRAYKLH